MKWHFFKWLGHVTGLMEAHCRTRHTRHQTLHQIEYGGGYVVGCARCGEFFYVLR